MPIDRIRSYALVLGVFTLLTTGCNNTLRKRDSLNGVYALTGEISGVDAMNERIVGIIVTPK